MTLYASLMWIFFILETLVNLCSGLNCPPGAVDGSVYNVPFCFFRPNNSMSLVNIPLAIRACRDSDPRSHLLFFPDATSNLLSTVFSAIVKNANMNRSTQLFAAGYGLNSNRSDFYWYRNVRGYPEMVMTQDSQWPKTQPDNALSDEYMMAIGANSLNDVSARNMSDFVCQLDPSLPYSTKLNANGTVPSTSSATCPSPWLPVDKLYYYMLNYTFSSVSSAMAACRTAMDPRATLPDFRDWSQWNALLKYLGTIPVDSRPSSRHRMIPLGYTRMSTGTYVDTKGNAVFSDWLPFYPDDSDPNKACVFMIDYNGYMWENRVCGYNESILWAMCQLNCSEPKPKCPDNYMDGTQFGLPGCYFQPIGNFSTKSTIDAIRICRNFDARSHLPFYPTATEPSILTNLFNLLVAIAYGGGSWWLVGGHGTDRSRSNFSWYRNVLGYPEYHPTPDSLWLNNQPDNSGGVEYFLSINNNKLLNDLPSSYAAGFVCQVDPLMPMPPDNNLNDTIVSKASESCPQPWTLVGKLFYFLINSPFSSVSDANNSCKSLDPRATLPEFRDYSQWNVVLTYIRQNIAIDSRPTTRHRIYPLGVTQVSNGQWHDSKGKLIFSDWLPNYPNITSWDKKCTMMVDYNAYMWENVACNYSDSVLWALCQLNCSESSPNCPEGYIDGFYYNLPFCYFRPKTAATVFAPDAIRACRDQDSRSHLPFFPNATSTAILSSLYKLMSVSNNGSSSWWFLGGYGNYTNRSSFYWYRNILGYPEARSTANVLWKPNQPDNGDGRGEFMLSMDSSLLNDLHAFTASGFICQMDPSVPVPPNKNLNGSLSSIQSSTCPSPWNRIDKLYYTLIPAPFADRSSAINACRTLDPRSTLPTFLDWMQWRALLTYIMKIPTDKRSTIGHRQFLLGVSRISTDEWQDAKENWVFSDWLPNYPDERDPDKNCAIMVDYNGYMWENVVCSYNESILWALCQLNCSETMSTTTTTLKNTSKMFTSTALLTNTVTSTTTLTVPETTTINAIAAITTTMSTTVIATSTMMTLTSKAMEKITTATTMPTAMTTTKSLSTSTITAKITTATTTTMPTEKATTIIISIIPTMTTTIATTTTATMTTTPISTTNAKMKATESMPTAMATTITTSTIPTTLMITTVIKTASITTISPKSITMAKMTITTSTTLTTLTTATTKAMETPSTATIAISATILKIATTEASTSLTLVATDAFTKSDTSIHYPSAIASSLAAVSETSMGETTAHFITESDGSSASLNASAVTQLMIGETSTPVSSIFSATMLLVSSTESTTKLDLPIFISTSISDTTTLVSMIPISRAIETSTFSPTIAVTSKLSSDMTVQATTTMERILKTTSLAAKSTASLPVLVEMSSIALFTSIIIHDKSSSVLTSTTLSQTDTTTAIWTELEVTTSEVAIEYSTLIPKSFSSLESSPAVDSSFSTSVYVIDTASSASDSNTHTETVPTFIRSTTGMTLETSVVVTGAFSSTVNPISNFDLSSTPAYSSSIVVEKSTITQISLGTDFSNLTTLDLSTLFNIEPSTEALLSTTWSFETKLSAYTLLSTTEISTILTTTNYESTETLRSTQMLITGTLGKITSEIPNETTIFSASIAMSSTLDASFVTVASSMVQTMSTVEETTITNQTELFENSTIFVTSTVITSKASGKPGKPKTTSSTQKSTQKVTYTQSTTKSTPTTKPISRTTKTTTQVKTGQPVATNFIAATSTSTARTSGQAQETTIINRGTTVGAKITSLITKDTTVGYKGTLKTSLSTTDAIKTTLTTGDSPSKPNTTVTLKVSVTVQGTTVGDTKFGVETTTSKMMSSLFLSNDADTTSSIQATSETYVIPSTGISPQKSFSYETTWAFSAEKPGTTNSPLTKMSIYSTGIPTSVQYETGLIVTSITQTGLSTVYMPVTSSAHKHLESSETTERLTPDRSTEKSASLLKTTLSQVTIPVTMSAATLYQPPTTPIVVVASTRSYNMGSSAGITTVHDNMGSSGAASVAYAPAQTEATTQITTLSSEYAANSAHRSTIAMYLNSSIYPMSTSKESVVSTYQHLTPGKDAITTALVLATVFPAKTLQATIKSTYPTANQLIIQNQSTRGLVGLSTTTPINDIQAVNFQQYAANNNREEIGAAAEIAAGTTVTRPIIDHKSQIITPRLDTASTTGSSKSSQITGQEHMSYGMSTVRTSLPGRSLNTLSVDSKEIVNVQNNTISNDQKRTNAIGQVSGITLPKPAVDEKSQMITQRLTAASTTKPFKSSLIPALARATSVPIYHNTSQQFNSAIMSIPVSKLSMPSTNGKVVTSPILLPNVETAINTSSGLNILTLEHSSFRIAQQSTHFAMSLATSKQLVENKSSKFTLPQSEQRSSVIVKLISPVTVSYSITRTASTIKFNIKPEKINEITVVHTSSLTMSRKNVIPDTMISVRLTPINIGTPMTFTSQPRSSTLASSSLRPSPANISNQQTKSIMDTPNSTSIKFNATIYTTDESATGRWKSVNTAASDPYKIVNPNSFASTVPHQTLTERYLRTVSMYTGTRIVSLNHSIEFPFSNKLINTDLVTGMKTIRFPILTPLNAPKDDDMPAEHSKIGATDKGKLDTSLSKEDKDFLKKASVDPEIFATWSNKDKLDAFMMDAAQISDFTITAGVKDTLPLMYTVLNKSLLASMGHQLDEMLLSCTSNDQKCLSYNKKATLSFNPFFLNCYTLEDKPIAISQSHSKSDLKLVLSTQKSEYLSISDKAGFVISIDDAYPHLNGYIANSGSMLDISITQLMMIKNVGHCVDDEDYSVDKCQAECWNRKTRLVCNCTDPRYCTSCDDACLPSKKLCLDQLEEKCVAIPGNMTCECPNRCKTTIYNRFLTVSKLNQPKRCMDQSSDFNISIACQMIGDNVVVYISFRTQSCFTFVEDFAYPLLQLISDIANTASLFTGVTLYVISEVAFAVCILATGKWRHE